MEERPESRSLWPSTGHLFSESAESEFARLSTGHQDAVRISDSVFSLVESAGYFKMGIPVRFGGTGGGLRECCRVQMRLGYHNPGVAIGLNMHLFTVSVMAEHWRKTKDMTWMLLEGMARKNSIVASAFAEPGLGGQILRSTVEAKKVRGGYELTGEKNPCSLATRSQLLCLQAVSDEKREDRLIIALLPAGTKGLSVKRNSSMWGMQQSESDRVILQNCYIPEALVFHRCIPGEDTDHIFAASVTWFCLTASSVYLGLCKRALDEAKDCLLKSRLIPGTGVRAGYSTFQESFGELWGMFSILESSLLGLCQEADKNPDHMQDFLSAALAVKNYAATVCPELVRRLAEICGGGAYLKKSLFTRLMKDVQAVVYHPPVSHNSRQILGRRELGLSANFDICSPGTMGQL